MFCPNCSAEAQIDQKFCRACGMELQAVGELVGAQTGLAKPEHTNEEFFHGRRRAMLVWGMILTLLAVALGSSLKILGKEHIQIAGEFTPYLSVITLLIAFFGMGLMCYPFLQIVSANRQPRSEGEPKSEPTVKLKPELLRDEPPSVTEHSTELFEASRSRCSGLDTAPQTETEKPGS